MSKTDLFMAEESCTPASLIRNLPDAPQRGIPEVIFRKNLIIGISLLSLSMIAGTRVRAMEPGIPLEASGAGDGKGARMEAQNLPAGIIQTAELNPELPLFIPTHPRVTTTLRFPGPIGAPEGRGFTEDEGKSPGEYLVSWTRGDSHVTVTPLAGAAALNLNIPYKNDTYVIYFYPVERQYQALASLRLSQAGTKNRQSTVRNEKQTRAGELPTTRLLGLLDKIKLLRAVAPGRGQQQLATTLGVELSCPTKEKADAAETQPRVLEIQITHVVRDPSLGALAFALRLINRSEKALTLDGVAYTAYCGGAAFQQGLAESPTILSGKEEAEAFLAIETEALNPLRAENRWSVEARSLSGSSLSQNTGEELLKVEPLEESKPQAREP